MAARNLFVVLLAILTIGQSDLSPITKTGDNVKSSILYEALVLMQTTIKAVTEEIKKVVDDAKVAIEKAAGKILEEGEHVLQSAKNISETLIESVRSAIESARDEVKDAGVDISECVAGQEEAARNAVEETLEGIEGCISDQASAWDQKRQELEDVIKEAIQFAEGAGDNITSCFKLSATLKVLNCVVQETSYVTRQASSIGSSIRDKIREAASFILQATRQVSQCAGAELQNAQERVAEIVRGVGECLNEKLSAKRSDN